MQSIPERKIALWRYPREANTNDPGRKNHYSRSFPYQDSREHDPGTKGWPPAGLVVIDAATTLVVLGRPFSRSVAESGIRGTGCLYLKWYMDDMAIKARTSHRNINRTDDPSEEGDDPSRTDRKESDMAESESNSCSLYDRNYPHDSHVCAEKTCMICNNGKWEETTDLFSPKRSGILSP